MKQCLLLFILTAGGFCSGGTENKQLAFIVKNLKNGKRTIKINGSLPDGIDPFTQTILGDFNSKALRKSESYKKLCKSSQDEKNGTLQVLLSCFDKDKDPIWPVKRKALALTLLAGANLYSEQLFSAIFQHDDHWLALLALQCGADVNQKQSLIYNANTVAMVKLLLACGASIENDSKDSSLIDRAICDERVDWQVLQLYLDKKITWKSKNIFKDFIEGSANSWWSETIDNFWYKLKLLMNTVPQDSYKNIVSDLQSYRDLDFTDESRTFLYDFCIRVFKNPTFLLDDFMGPSQDNCIEE